MVAAGLSDLRTVAPGCAGSRVQSAPGFRWTQISIDVPQSSALWHQLGCSWRRNVLLRHRAPVFPGAEAISRRADRKPSTGGRKADLDGHGDLQGTTSRVAGGTSQGCRQGWFRADFYGEAEQCVD